jgi:hypothetical protein
MFVFKVASKSAEVKKEAEVVKTVALTAGCMFAYFTVLRIM